MGKKTIFVMTLAVVSIISGLVSCKATESATSYKIGALVSQTGNYAGLGLQALDGMQFIVDQVNEDGGINGIPMELVLLDVKSEATEVTLAARKLDEVNKVIALAEGTVTQLALSLIPVANELEIPSTGISGTALLDNQLGHWFFRPMGSEVDYAFLLLNHMSQYMGISKYAVLIENSGYGQGGKVFLPQLNPNHNLTIAGEEYFDPGATDLTPQLTKIKNSEAQAILIWGSSPTASMAIKQIREMGISLPILTTPAQASKDMIKSFGEYYELQPSVVSVTTKVDIWDQLPADDPDRESFKNFAESFEEKYGHPPAMWNILGATMMLFFADGLERSIPDPSNITEARAELRDALEATKDLNLISGTYTMSPDDHYGGIENNLVLITYKDGQMVYLP